MNIWVNRINTQDKWSRSSRETRREAKQNKQKEEDKKEIKNELGRWRWWWENYKDKFTFPIHFHEIVILDIFYVFVK